MAKNNVDNVKEQQIAVKNNSANVETAEGNVEAKPKRKLNKFQILNIVLASCLVAIALGISIYFIVANHRTPLKEVLTPENYEEITVGMSYDDVFDLLGAGKRMASAGSDEVTYVWQSNNGKMIVVTFSATRSLGGIKADKVIDKGELNVYS